MDRDQHVRTGCLSDAHPSRKIIRFPRRPADRIAVSGIDHTQIILTFQDRPGTQCDLQRDVFFHRPIRRDAPRIISAMTAIQYDDPCRRIDQIRDALAQRSCCQNDGQREQRP